MVTRLKQSQLSNLTALQYGSPLPTSLTFRAELSWLTHSYPTRPRFQTFFERQNRNTERYNYITHIAPSPDRSLAAIASRNGCIEVHEPAVEDSHRLSLERVSPNSRISTLAYPSNLSGDHILAAASHTGAIYHYDIQNCRIDKPTTQFQISNLAKDIAEMEGNCFAASTSEKVSIFDMRRGRSEVASVLIPTSVMPCLVVQGYALIVGTECRMLTYDWRKLQGTKRISRQVKSFQSGSSPKHVVKEFALVDGTQQTLGILNSMCALPDALDGFLLIHTSQGTIGTVDITSGRIDTLGEIRPQAPSRDGLYQYGYAFASMGDPKWYIARRRVDVIKGTGARGWRVLVPNVRGPGVRIVAVSGDMPLQQFNIPALENVDATTVLSVNGKLDKLVVGTTTNGLEAIEIDMGRRRREERLVQESSSTT